MLHNPKNNNGKMELPEIRCKQCGKLLGFVKGKYEIKCSRCKAVNTKVWADNLSDDNSKDDCAKIL